MTDDEKQNKKRFKKINREGSGFTSTVVLVDRETNVQYLVVKRGYGVGITPLLDANGKLLLYTD